MDNLHFDELDKILINKLPKDMVKVIYNFYNIRCNKCNKKMILCDGCNKYYCGSLDYFCNRDIERLCNKCDKYLCCNYVSLCKCHISNMMCINCYFTNFSY